MELKEITVRYAGKCVKCQRELKVGWTAFFDSEKKELYCRPCSREVLQDSSLTEPVPLAEPLTQEELALIPEELQSRLQAVGLIKALTLEDRVKMLTVIIANLQAIVETFDERLVDISESQHDTEKLLKSYLAISAEVKKSKKEDSS